MSDKQQEMWDVLSGLSGEKVAGLLTDWHGLQLLDDGFYDFLIDEGYIDEAEDLDAGMKIEDSEDFDDFCASYGGCTGCPFERDYSAECIDLYERAKETLK